MSKWSILTAYSKNGLEKKLEEKEAQGWTVHPESLNLNTGEDGFLEFWILISKN
jgi:hypothetical protein